MQAIRTKFIPATNTKPCRIKAMAERGSITIDYPEADHVEDSHRIAAQALIDKFIAEDMERYADMGCGYDKTQSSWYGKYHQGCFNNEFYHVFEED
jgi:hypothetical protein